MKRLILLELILLFLATTFMTDGTPGWVQQTLPVSDFVNDISFVDSLRGWCVAGTHIVNTSNGGANWVVQFQDAVQFKGIQFLDINNGISIGNGSSISNVYNTTNSGINWVVASALTIGPLLDLYFVNKDTGWFCEDNGFDPSVLKTTNGGVTLQPQLSQSFHIIKLFFLNKDTGWAGSSEANGKLYKTTNGGTNWNLQFTSNIAISSIFFLTSQKGWIRGGTGNGCMYTTDGGSNWNNAQGNVASGYDLKFVNDSVGYSGGSLQKVAKSTDGGRNWGYQSIPIFDALQTSFFRNDTNLGWMGSNGIIKTTDGGGQVIFTGIHQISNETPSDFKLYQNYPNPFNPNTNIKYELKVKKFVKLKVFDITGKEVTALVNQTQNVGTYQADFDGSNYPSGAYFYQLTVSSEQSAEVYTETKKMILIK